jgi:glycosyltransferase involved in cell wall biosynthesis
MARKLQVVFYSVIPSPYQRDLFAALAQCPAIELQVYYLEAGAADSPWERAELEAYERVLPGVPLMWGSARFPINWHIPPLDGVDVVVLNGYQSLTAQWVLHQFADRIPCIFWGEKMVASSVGMKGRLQQALAQGLQNCRAIAAIGSRAQQDYQSRFPHHSVFNLPYYCNLEPFTNLPRSSSDRPTILFCGQMIPRKGVDLLLQAFERLVMAGLSARLLLVGREAELPQMMASLSPQTKHQIEYAGFHQPQDLPQFFAQADLFVLPSRYDGWGVVVNQALGAGLPIICSNAVGAAVDLVEPEVNGAIVPAGDVDALYQALMNYLQTPGKLRMAGQASLDRGAKWTVGAGAQRWLNVFHQVGLMESNI